MVLDIDGVDEEGITCQGVLDLGSQEGNESTDDLKKGHNQVMQKHNR